MYSDFNFYVSTYGGTKIPDSVSFGKYAELACSYMKSRTMNGISDITKNVKMCECELAERYAMSDRVFGIESESTDGENVSYSSAKTILGGSYAVLERWLWDSGLLYRGI